MTEFTPFRMTKPAPQAQPPEPPKLAGLYDTMHDGICRHCAQWTLADSVFMLLPHMGRVVCMRCAETITEKPLRMDRKLYQEALDAANRVQQ